LTPSSTVITLTTDGYLRFRALTFRCALGKGGVKADKREGDGATPAGVWPLRQVLYRADRLAPPVCAFPVQALTPQDGWCDDPSHPDYNHFVLLPHPARCERLWREDAVYDLIVPLGYNDQPVVPGRGSAIFLHVAHADFRPTEGCVALAKDDLVGLLSLLPANACLEIPAPSY
jgi:L,D-peptidoglycan transpeptidase YkuD (ErfK/YbiS/YcfS/YnhG family)